MRQDGYSFRSILSLMGLVGSVSAVRQDYQVFKLLVGTDIEFESLEGEDKKLRQLIRDAVDAEKHVPPRGPHPFFFGQIWTAFLTTYLLKNYFNKQYTKLNYLYRDTNNSGNAHCQDACLWDMNISHQQLFPDESARSHVQATALKQQRPGLLICTYPTNKRS